MTAFDIPADLDTPVSAFLKLGPLGACTLLESVEGGERVARYSFIGFGDRRTVVLDGDTLRIDDQILPAPPDATGLRAALRDVLATSPHPTPIPGVPFAGGLVGFGSYDLVRRLERLPVRAAPIGVPDGAWVATRSVLVFDHVHRRAALLHDGADREAVRRDVLRLLHGPIPPQRSGSAGPPVANLDRDTFLERVATVRGHIDAGDVFQLVLSIAFQGETDLPPFEVYRALRRTNPSPYLSFVDIAGLQIVGSSPETLARLDGRTATLCPIAGTAPRGATPEADHAHEVALLADPKEAAEHVMLVDLARNDLGRVAVPGSIRVAPYRTVQRFSHVMHLVSGVQGQLRDGLDAFDLYVAAFPAGTVVGAPKVRAMELIEAFEPERRGVYGGTVGYFGHDGGMDQAIAIRTVVLRDGTYRYQAGAGIVADSVPEREHAEILAKSAAMATALGVAS